MAAFRWLVGGLALGLGLLFAGLTVLTLAVWAADPASAETNPVVDLGFFGLGGLIITAGFASQVRAREPRPAGLQQALVGLVALSAAGAIGTRVEPFALGLALVVLALLAAALHPAGAARLLGRPRRRGHGHGPLSARAGHVDRPLAALALVVALPAAVYASGMLALARDAGPSCFAGQCARGDRYAEMAALAAAIVVVTLLASAGPTGRRLGTWCAGGAAALVGAASIVLPDVIGSLGLSGGALAASWGVLLIVTGERHARRAPRTTNRGG
jgi:hypothetical protein